MEMRDKLSMEEWLPMLESIRPGQSDRNSVADRSERRGTELSRAGSLAVGAINQVSTVKELIDSIIQEAEELLDSWQFLKTR